VKFKPPKKEGCAANAALGKLKRAAIILALLRKITSSACTIWRSESLRLFGEWQRTKKIKHLRAFVRHCRGVEARLGA